MRNKPRYVSGIRPTGQVHLGNYLGAIKQWRELGEGIFFIADLHSPTTTNEIAETRDALSKCGIEDIKLESTYREGILGIYHKLSFAVPVGWLSRMTQFRDKSNTEDATLALFAYPVLMAADIFYFGGTHIPVGEDQLQHLHFTRDLAEKFGYKKPEAVIGNYPRIMSLKDGTKKMSKSDPDDYTRINVTDTPDKIRDKIRLAKTSMNMEDETPEMQNLKTIYKALGGVQDHAKCKDFKEELAEMMINEFN